MYIKKVFNTILIIFLLYSLSFVYKRVQKVKQINHYAVFEGIKRCEVLANNKINIQDKIWFFRANKINIAHKAIKSYAGIEIDVVFENEKFDVSHPPEPLSGIILEQFIMKLNNYDKPYYMWLDIKNINNKNYKQIKKRLEYLVKKFNLKNNLIIEARSDPKYLDYIGSNLTVFYNITNKVNWNNDIVKLQKNITNVCNDLKYYKNISCIYDSYKNYQYLKYYFVNQNYIMYYNRHTKYNIIDYFFENKSDIKKNLKDNNLKVVLWRNKVDYK